MRKGKNQMPVAMRAVGESPDITKEGSRAIQTLHGSVAPAGWPPHKCQSLHLSIRFLTFPDPL